MASPHPALARLAPAPGQLTLGLELPLDNDWDPARQHADREAGRPFGVPDLTGHTRLARLARLADRLGFAALWLRDVPLYDPVQFGDAGSVFETFTHLGHLAAVTDDVVLATGAIVLPLREPLLVAKAAATVDVLSGGRMLLGLASGDRPVKYPLFGRDFQQRGRAFREGVETLRAAWHGGPLELPRAGLGADRQLDALPKPVHRAGIPIAVAGSAQQTSPLLLEPGDMVIDGGNAHFADTRRRERALRERGLPFVSAPTSSESPPSSSPTPAAPSPVQRAPARRPGPGAARLLRRPHPPPSRRAGSFHTRWAEPGRPERPARTPGRRRHESDTARHRWAATTSGEVLARCRSISADVSPWSPGRRRESAKQPRRRSLPPGPTSWSTAATPTE
ncbi:LLM class flavin-dependent oxidoreductase [Streptomyces sp. NPDC057557]|uniref:LLM class flavin-dependent oxidoreductase n=1 Tax=Streptomyces sp. NPDC057557 TaxID=3346167 RepID=UPI0036C5AC23